MFCVAGLACTLICTVGTGPRHLGGLHLPVKATDHWPQMEDLVSQVVQAAGGLQRVALLKRLEELTAEAFTAAVASGTDEAAAAAVAALGGSPEAARERVLRAALRQQLTGIPEYRLV